MKHDVPLSTLIASARDIMAKHAYQSRYIATDPNGRPTNPCRERVALSFHGAVIRACYGLSGKDIEVFAFLKEYSLIPKRSTATKSDCLGLLDRAYIVAKRIEDDAANPIIDGRAA